MATIVAFHAHPDDEALATGGTLARLAAEGHRVIIVVATDGFMGPATGEGAQTSRHDARALRAGFTPRSAITHRLNVRRFAAQKRTALAAHRSFAQSSGRSARLARVMVALPVPVFGLLLGREWFVEPGAAKTAVSGDILSRPQRADLV